MRGTSLRYEDFAKKVQLLLKENPMWKHKYGGYMRDIKAKAKDVENSPIAACDISEPMYKYGRIGDIRETKLRYMGQDIAELKVTTDAVYVKPLAKENKYFIFEAYTPIEQQRVLTAKDGFAYGSKEWGVFKQFFEERPVKQNHNNEHTMESNLITDLQNKSNILPILLPGAKRFQLRTPLTASEAKSDKVHYSQRKFPKSAVINPEGAISGGGIDILARCRGESIAHPVVIELKDKYESQERPERAIKQAIAYAVFLRELLRSEDACGQAWYSLFGFEGTIPKKLTIKCAVAMPDIPPEEFRRFEDVELDGDVLELHCICLTEDGKVRGEPTQGFCP